MYRTKIVRFLGAFLFLLSVAAGTALGFQSVHTLYKVLSFQKDAHGILLTCQADNQQKVLLRIDVCTPDLLRFRMTSAPDFKKNADLLVKMNWPPVKVSFSEQPGVLLLKTRDLTLRLQRNPFSFQISAPRGVLLETETPDGLRFDKKRVYAFFKMRSDDHFFGLGAGKGVGMTSWASTEHFNLLDKRRQEINILGRRIPFFMNPRGYGIFMNSTNLTTFELGSKMPGRFSMRTENTLLDFYFIFGPDFKHILAQYTELTGRAPLIPKWAFGLRQAGYWDQKQVETYARLYRQKHLPCDLIHIDSGWLDKGSKYEGHGIHFGKPNRGYVDFQWDRRQFPNPKAMIATLKAQGYKVSLWETSLVNPNVGQFFDKAAARGYFMKMPDGSPALVHYSSRGPSAVVDFSNPKAAEWWKQQHKYLVDMGIDAFKLDISSELSNAKLARFYNGKRVKEMRILHKLWNLRTVYEATKDYTHRRGYIFSSIAAPGSQRFPVHWSGDYKNDFEGIQGKIRSSQNMGLSGFAYYSPDFPSRRNLTDSVLFVRWAEYGLLNPVCQDWCNLPWNFGKQAEEIFRFYDNLHYRLIPYFYSYAWKAHETGVPIVRALVLEYPYDPNVYSQGLEFLLGQEFLVAPICANSKFDTTYSTRSVYLPKGNWIDYWTGRVYKGHATISVKAALDKIPLFVKAGAIIPMGPVMQYVEQKPVNPLTLDIYPWKTSSFTLYEDDGITYAYENGAFARTTFVCSQQPNHLVVEIGPSRGHFKGQLKKRTYILKLNGVNRPVKIRLEGKKLPLWRSRHQLETHKSGWWYSVQNRRLWIKIGSVKTSNAQRIVIQE